MLSKILHDWELERKVTTVTSDNGSEIPNAVEMLQVNLDSKYDRRISGHKHIRCACHIIHRRVNNALGPINKTMEKIRSLMSTIKYSPHNRELFKEALKNLEITEIKDVASLDIENRWSSTFEIIETCYNFKSSFECVCNDERGTNSIKGKNLSEE